MKKHLFFAAVFILFTSLFSSVSFAQTDPGGYSDGGPGPDGEPKSQPSPVYFKRNNGNGTCGHEGQLRVFFNLNPDYLPTILDIWYEGKIIPVHIDPIDPTELSKKGYVSYCISNKNIPPACKLWIRFNYYQSNQTFWLMEANHL